MHAKKREFAGIALDMIGWSGKRMYFVQGANALYAGIITNLPKSRDLYHFVMFMWIILMWMCHIHRLFALLSLEDHESRT